MKKHFLSAVILLMSLNISAVTVTFVDWDGSVLAESDVLSGEGAYEPEHPVRDGYFFSGWDNGFAPAYANTTVTALYQQLSEASEDVHVYWPLCEHTNATVEGPVEPFSLQYQNIGDLLYSTTVSNITFPDGYNYDASHKIIMLNMPETEALATTYDPYIYAQVAIKAATNINIDEIALLVGSTGWDNFMRFTVRYARQADFSDAVELTTTDKLAADVMTEIREATMINLQAGETLYIRLHPWMDNLPEVFANMGVAFYPLLSEMHITGSVSSSTTPGDTPGDDPTEDIDNTDVAVKTVKFFQNGQLFIEKNGVRYNAIGNVIK